MALQRCAESNSRQIEELSRRVESLEEQLGIATNVAEALNAEVRWASFHSKFILDLSACINLRRILFICFSLGNAVIGRCVVYGNTRSGLYCILTAVNIEAVLCLFHTILCRKLFVCFCAANFWNWFDAEMSVTRSVRKRSSRGRGFSIS